MKLLPKRRLYRIAIYVVVLIGYASILWFELFPYLDRTFVNRPAF
jgi:hypothetical protein